MIITADRASDILELFPPSKYDAHVRAYREHKHLKQWMKQANEGFANVMAELQKMNRRAT